MKKICIIFLLSIIISLTALGISGNFGNQSVNDGTMSAMNEEIARENEYLRIHIRAHSNAQDAQDVKYVVRDKVVEYLTPLVAFYPDKASALQGISSHLPQIAQTADKALKAQGFAYGAKAELKRERFPSRVYGDEILPAGEYDALIIYLGSGQGDNWWCVVYPPLCFAAPSGQNVVYKSKILEIIRKFRNKNG